MILNKTSIIKLKDIKIQNVKNVRSGEITLKHSEKFNKVLGIYGQNGSGKTALVDAMIILQTVISGKKMKDNILDLINDDNHLKVSITLEVINEREIYYSFSLRKVEVKNESNSLLNNVYESNNYELEISEEILETLTIDKTRRRTLLSYSADNKDYPLLTKNIFPDNKINVIKLDYVKEMAKQNRESFIFGKGMEKFIAEQPSKENINELKECMILLKNNLSKNLFIHSNSQFGMIYSNAIIPLNYYIEINHRLTSSGVIHISSEKVARLKANEFHLTKVIFDQINGVLPHIIPGLKIEINTMEEASNDNEEEYVFELISDRNGKKIPFRSESDGIKKIVCVLSNIISAYNNPNIIAVIDELDSGIYEYLLGEILEAFSESAEGTLIFTSHNLRPLEVLKPKEVFFTTTNPDNRYINIPDVKSTNNLRTKYLRAIQLGGYSEELYKSTNKFEIKNSMKRTHRKILRKFEEIINART